MLPWGIMKDCDVCDIYDVLFIKKNYKKWNQIYERKSFRYRTFELSKDKETFIASHDYFYPMSDKEIKIFIPRRLIEEVVILHKLKKSMV